ncbi:MAG: NAD(P)/FAD-dependent oxidoreductase [Candidatus Dormibacteraceae bacterium]
MSAGRGPRWTSGQVVVVGASLAGLRAGEALRQEGFTGDLTIVGAEPYAPYDLPPLSKGVLAGRTLAASTSLAQAPDLKAKWLLGVPASGLDTDAKTVTLADGRVVPWDKALIATGTRARPWPDPDQARLKGVFSVRNRDAAGALRTYLAAGPKRVLVIGGGFIGCEVASVCRELSLQVTLVERSSTPLSGAFGRTAGSFAAMIQRHFGVDLRCDTTVEALEGDAEGRLTGARLSDGDRVEAEIAVVALGAVRNIEWLAGSGLAADARGVVCDASCRVFDAEGIVTDDVYAAGDVARWPDSRWGGALLTVEHWSNAVEQARTAAHNMVCAPSERRAHHPEMTFWSNQFGSNIKSVGLPAGADQIAVTQGSTGSASFAVVYGKEGRVVAAVTVNAPRYLDGYAALIGKPFPPQVNAADAPDPIEVLPADFPTPGERTNSPTATSTGPGPTSGRPTPLVDPRRPARPTILRSGPELPPRGSA